MPNDFVTTLKRYGPVVLVSAAVGAGIYALLTPDEEERPPIIVQNGTVEFRAAYADAVNAERGYWEQVGASGKWRIKHDHLTGPTDIVSEIYNGNCSGNGWRVGPLKITYASANTTWTIDVVVTGNDIVIDAGTQMVTRDSTDFSHLTVGDSTVKTWITKVEQRGGGDSCTFDGTSAPVIRLRQKR